MKGKLEAAIALIQSNGITVSEIKTLKQSNGKELSSMHIFQKELSDKDFKLIVEICTWTGVSTRLNNHFDTDNTSSVIIQIY